MTAWYIQRKNSQPSQEPNPTSQGTANAGIRPPGADRQFAGNGQRGRQDANQHNATEEIGPLRPAELLKLVRSGEVTPETKIRKDNSGWFNASAVGGLFEAARRPTIEYFCPVCNALIPEPPCGCPSCGREILKARARITEHGSPGEEDNSPGAPSGRSVQRWLQRIKKKKNDE